MSLNKYPKISIVTPVYNQVHFIEQTICSVINQGYPNLEYIIIDGGSTDGTIDIIKKYSNRISYWVSEPDNGMYDAIQKGFEKSTGEIMGWLNSDDIYYDKCLFAVANAFQNNPQVEWLTGMQTTIDAEGLIIRNAQGRFLSKYNFIMRDFQWISQESTLWRRDLWNKCGGRLATSLRYAGDFELWLRFIQQSPLYHLQSPIGTYRIRQGQLSSEIEKYLEEVDSVYNGLVISAEDQKVCRQYSCKIRLMNSINKTKVLNGGKIVRIKSFLNKYFPQLVLKWDSNSGIFTIEQIYH